MCAKVQSEVIVMVFNIFHPIVAPTPDARSHTGSFIMLLYHGSSNEFIKKKPSMPISKVSCLLFLLRQPPDPIRCASAIPLQFGNPL
jgi:hypothetical protein